MEKKSSDGEEINQSHQILETKVIPPPHPTPSCYRKKIKKLLNISVLSILLRLPTCQLHLSASSWISQAGDLDEVMWICTSTFHVTLVNQSKFLWLRITKQRGSLRTRGVTLSFFKKIVPTRSLPTSSAHQHWRSQGYNISPTDNHNRMLLSVKKTHCKVICVVTWSLCFPILL